MADQRKIEGVPEGYELDRLGTPAENEPWLRSDGVISFGTNIEYARRYVPVLKRIPKPKQRVFVAEWDLPPGRRLPLSDGHLPNVERYVMCPPDRQRIEERELERDEGIVL